jgi:hypothetical protein
VIGPLRRKISLRDCQSAVLLISGAIYPEGCVQKVCTKEIEPNQ